MRRRGDPARQRKEDRSAWKIKDLCEDHLREAEAGHILGKRGNPKQLSTLAIDRDRMSRHVVPRLGKKVVKELNASDIRQFFVDVKAGKTAAKRCVGLLQGILQRAPPQAMADQVPGNGERQA